jgi:hypothetical protein
MALYDNAGNLVATNDDDSTANMVFASLLSFGMGRRAAIVAGGSERDGAAYEGTQAGGIKGLTAADGPYMLAVAGFGAAFLPGRNVAGSWSGGNVSISFETNTNGAALAPSVAPDVSGGADLGSVVSPGSQSPAVALLGYAVDWVKFTICANASAPNMVTLDFSQMQAENDAGWVWALFSDSGNLLESASSAGVPANRVYDGTTGNVLAAGSYYIALSNYGGSFDVAPLAATDGRWHFRDRNGNNGFNAQVSVTVTWASCPAPCCRNDFNGDGDVGTDADIEDFFTCLAGTCCANCPPNADFNCDGDVGTDADIEAFFRVLAGGNC